MHWKVPGEVTPQEYSGITGSITTVQDEMTAMEERQRRSDVLTAKAVARGLNILAIRNRSIARNYMEYKRVPAALITRVLNTPLRAPGGQ